ncbi:MAG: YraN family protein [Vallitalea sp.]|jgi:putative endonuclease|nr:YraN family protein [Vallitalea sp.]
MRQNNRAIGTIGEDIACKYLKNNGYNIIDRNYRCRHGEIDIIAIHDEYIVFVEVKYRKDAMKGYPSEAVGYYKQQRIINTAIYYAKIKGLFNSNIRFDIVEIVNNKIRVIKNAFTL